MKRNAASAAVRIGLVLGLPSHLCQAAGATAALLAPAAVCAQGTRSDYERAAQLGRTAAEKVFKTRLEAHWFADNTRFWYRNELPGAAREFVLVDAIAGTREPAFDHVRLAAALSDVTGSEIRSTHLPIDSLAFDAADPVVVLRAGAQSWRCDLRTYQIAGVEAAAEPASGDGGAAPPWRRRATVP